MTRDQFCSTISDAIDRCAKTQVQIARELGYRQSNFVTMLKKGRNRVPHGKVHDLALSLGLDPDALVRSWFEAYQPNAVAFLARFPATRDYGIESI